MELDPGINDCFFYWDHPLVISRKDYKAYTLLVKTILSMTSEEVVNGLGKPGTKPYVTKDHIVFCSPTESKDHEPDSFMFPRVSDDLAGLNLGHIIVGTGDFPTMYTRLCNTKYLGYTAAVVACLRAAKHVGIIGSYYCTGNNFDDILQDGWDIFDTVKLKLTNSVN